MNYYRDILVVAAVLIFYTAIPGYAYFFTQDSRTAPVVWVVGFFVLALPALMAGIGKRDILKSPLIAWCFGFAWVTGAWFLLSSQSDMAWQAVRWRIFAIIQLLMFLFLFSNERAIRLARQALIGGVLIGVALNLYELFVPGSFSLVPGRSAGLYQNPNITGEALVMGMVCSVGVLPLRFRALFILLAGSGVFVTFSRGSILAWVIAVIGLLLTGGVRLKDVLLSIFVASLLVVVSMSPKVDQLYATFGSVGATDKNIEERLTWLSDPTGVHDYSSWERAYVAKQAWESISEHPFLGSGTGASREEVVGVHNQYLAFVQDHGLLGAAILPLLVLSVTWGVRGETRHSAMVFGATVLVISVFTHNILDLSHTIILFALMAAMAASSREEEIKKTQGLATRKVGLPKALVGAQPSSNNF